MREWRGYLRYKTGEKKKESCFPENKTRNHRGVEDRQVSESGCTQIFEIHKSTVTDIWNNI